MVKWPLAMLVLLAACGGDGGDAQPQPAPVDPVAFYPAELVTQPKVLDGDPTSGRCPDATQPCFKDNKDILNGQRTLAPVDDVALVFLSTVNGANFDTRATLLSSNSRLAAPTYAFLNDPNPDKLALGMTSVAARFEPRAENLVRLALYGTTDNNGNASYGLSVLSEGFNAGYFFPPFAGASMEASLLATSADFDGSGVDRIVYVADRRIGVVAPVLTDGNLSGLTIPTTVPNIGTTSDLTTARFFDNTPVAVAAVSDPSTGVQIQFFKIDPVANSVAFLGDKTLTLRINPNFTMDPASVRIAAGRFNDPSYDQLAVAFEVSDANGPAGTGMITIGRDANGKVREVQAVPQLYTHSNRAKLFLKKGRFLTSDPYEGVVLMRDFSPGINSVELLDLSNNLTPTSRGTTQFGPNNCVYGMEPGNFDRSSTDGQGNVLANLNMQLALALGYDCGNGTSDTFTALIWQVSAATDPNSKYPLELKGSGADTSSYQIPPETIANPVYFISLAALDLQGRSKVLGAPKIVTIENRSQPTVVIAAPPMHADYLDRKLINFTAAPGGFYTSYQTSDSSDAKASSKATTTWSFAAEESVGVTATYGVCQLGDCATVADTASAKQSLNGSSSALNSSFNTASTSVSQATAFHDVLWYSDSALTTYVYPVLGRTVCSAGKGPNCSDADKVPLTLVVAGPDTVQRTRADAADVWWYQPPWVPGNVLSYPGTLGQLRAGALNDPSTFNLLSQPQRWFTDNTNSTEISNWSSGTGSGSASSFDRNFSFDNKLSVSGTVFFEVGSASGTASLDLGGSFGFQNLTDSSTTMTQTTGLGFTKHAGFATPQTYGYWVTPYIFAQKTPPGADAPSPLTDVQGFGTLQSGFVVDVLASGAGTVWREKYASAPDLALLHPLRMTSAGRPTNQGEACLAVNDIYDCVSVASSQPTKPGDDHYHSMRGFFISSASAPGQGPQLTSAYAGDQLVLQARVHNLSLAPMPAGSKVMVRFYGMPWDTSNNRANGASFVIGTASAPPVLPYHTSDDSPNWVLVSQAFDTTAYAEQDLMFWVVTWIEDADGLIGELPDKGLTKVPDAGLDFVGVAELEQAHSNNLGFFNQALHIFPPRNSPTAGIVTPATQPSVRITDVGSEANFLRRGETTLVAARVLAGENDLRGGLQVDFFEGDPAAGGKLIGTRRLPFLRANASHDFRTVFRSGDCGSHTVYAVAGRGTRFEHVARLQPLQVSCS